MTLDPLEVYNRGLANPDALTQNERLIFWIMDFEVYVAMEGWDHFFFTKSPAIVIELIGWHERISDSMDVALFREYKDDFMSANIPFEPDSIFDFVMSDEYQERLNGLTDWQSQYHDNCEERWLLAKQFLAGQGITLQETESKD